MKQKLADLRQELEELKKTPTFLKPARAEQAVHKSFELVAELAETVDQLRFKVEALDPICREALAKMKADDGQA